ncbi:MAG TPA: methyltransferase domain-containing protein [Opitutaceae bacterium]|nr:methyltransferase domain-containing protein [Opitutaceae bacterium]
MPEDPNQPEFWNRRYDDARLPWDFNGVPADLSRFLAAGQAHGDVLIPGCGSGYEVAAFAAAGCRVTAIDFSPPAVDRARAHVGPVLADRIVLGDFFTHPFSPASFDLIYERTFLCALPPARWPLIARRLGELLKPGGRLVGFFFFGDKDDGPPFGLAAGEAGHLFDSAFTLETDEPVADSLPLFAGGERWQIRRRKPRQARRALAYGRTAP